MDLDRNCLKADCHAPFPWFQASCSSGSGGSQRRIQSLHCALCYAVTERPSLAFAARPHFGVTERPSLAVIRKEAVSLYPVLQSLRDPTLVSLRDPLPKSNVLSGSEQYGKGSWQSAFLDQLSKGTLRRKKLYADPTRDASLCRAPFPWF